MTGNKLTRALFFWPGALLIRFGQLLLRCSHGGIGRYTIRPAFRLFCRFVLYARPLLVGRSRTNDVVPTSQLRDLLADQKFIAAIPCVCRAGQAPCECLYHEDHDLDVCLSFGLAAVIQIGSGLGKRLSREEAMALCEKAMASGLAHHAIYSFGALLEVCNCCSQTCSVVKAHEAGVPEAIRPSPLVAVRGPGCDGCRDRESRTCEAICPYGKGPSSSECFGCELCSGYCPRGSISLILRGERGERGESDSSDESGRSPGPS